MTPSRRALLALAAGAMLPPGACRPVPSATHRPPGDPDALADWIAMRPDGVGLVAYTPGHENDGVYLRPDALFPLASTKKVLILCAYAERLAAGALSAEDRVPLADIERWHWPGTDGGAHDRALAELSQRGRITDRALTLDDAAWAMIRWSDNAASDYVFRRVGGPAAVAAVATRAGMTRQDPVMSIYGEYVAWATVPAREWLGMAPAARAARSLALADATPRTALASLALPSPATQRRLATANGGGTPREWARLMAAVLADALPEAVARHLEWPMEAFPSNRRRFERFGSKGGTLAGVNTQATFVRPRRGRPLVVALFFRDLPPDVERAFGDTECHQRFVTDLAADDALWSRVWSASR